MSRSTKPSVEALWRSRLQNQSESGLTIEQFCRQEGVSTSNFFAWKRRLASAQSQPIVVRPRIPAFVPVAIQSDVKPVHSPSNDHVVIHLAEGRRVLLPVAAGADLICRVVDTVARSSDLMENSSC